MKYLIICLFILVGCIESKSNVKPLPPPSVEKPAKPSRNLDPDYNKDSISGQSIIKAKNRKVETENDEVILE